MINVLPETIANFTFFSEYSIHFTKFRRNKTINKCKVKSWGEYVGDIPNLGTDEMKILYSPGFELDEP